jgi:hypothetical protein
MSFFGLLNGKLYVGYLFINYINNSYIYNQVIINWIQDSNVILNIGLNKEMKVGGRWIDVDWTEFCLFWYSKYDN